MLDNLSYDIITVLHEKSKGLEAYDKYMKDTQSDNEVRQAFEEIRRSDEQHIQRLRTLLARTLSQDRKAA